MKKAGVFLKQIFHVSSKGTARKIMELHKKKKPTLLKLNNLELADVEVAVCKMSFN